MSKYQNRISLFLFLFPFIASAQSALVPVGSETYHLIDRIEIKRGRISDSLHTSHKPYRRDQIAQLLYATDTNESWSSRDRFNRDYLLADNFDWSWDDVGLSRRQTPLIKSIYIEKAFFLSHYDDNFEIYANPVFNFNAGYTDATAGAKSIYTNSRGAEFRGSIAKKVGFYTIVTENQVRLPFYVDRRVDSSSSLPGVGFLKGFGVNGYDYLMARGYITFSATPFINFQFGHDRNFSGNGMRSLILSDFAREYLFLKVNTQVWKLNYQNTFMELFAGNSFSGVGSQIAKKYAAHHHLSLNITKNLNIGLSETVVFSRNDTLGSRGFELNYLNPIIFYRSVEQNLNSSDNAMVGMDFKWNFYRHFSFYGQFMLDEFVIGELRSGNGWWANKFAIQGGLKYIDMFNISNLDLQLETNLVRPYTYTHFRTSQNYSHYGQQLAHPLGANFYEGIAVLRYQPLNRLNVRATFSYAVVGMDSDTLNMGQNIFKNYDTHLRDYGNYIAQGDRTTILYAELYVSFMLKHNLFLWGSAAIRESQSSTGLYNSSELWGSLGVRLNLAHRQLMF